MAYPTLPLIDTTSLPHSDIQYSDLEPEGSSDDEYFVTAPTSPVMQGKAVMRSTDSPSFHLEQTETQHEGLDISPIEPRDAAYFTLSDISSNIPLTSTHSHSTHLLSQSHRPENYDDYLDPESESDLSFDCGEDPPSQAQLKPEPEPEPEPDSEPERNPQPYPDPSLPFTTLASLWSRPPKAFPLHGPPCLACRRPSTFARVSLSNVNDNALRPFYRCTHCDRWATWADMRGVKDTNVACGCGIPSRECVTGRRAMCGPGKRFWVCVEGRCRFLRWDNDEGRQESLRPDTGGKQGLSGERGGVGIVEG
ncbi:hypothetical protein MMYC01_207007 [Madurella mycetomatis]|uniref:GRF-type domain-containing protein n=1 Tax=Madurella mycetomatis TaxID=100816 RepID=A0A175VW67_9PEZI|nr:hypothetical protein MMYC01_207007 [Madurella mycetomatis]